MLVLTLVAVHPLPWRMASEHLVSGRDRMIFLWNVWWVNHAVTALHQAPFNTEYLFAPEGVSLSFHTLCTAGGFLGMVLGAKHNLIMATNLLLLLSFVLGGWFTYLLIRELTGTGGGAIFGGVLFAFGPAHWYPVYRGQMHIYSSQWIPLFLFVLVRFVRKPNRRNAALGAILLAAIFYTSYQQMVFTFVLALIILPIVVLPSYRNGTPLEWKRLLAGVVISSVIFMVLASPLALEMWNHHDEARVRTDAVEWRTMAVSLEQLLTGTRYYREWTRTPCSGPFASIWCFIQGLPPEQGPILGFMALLLFVSGWLSLIRGRRGVAFFWPIVYLSLALIPIVWIMLGAEPSIFGTRLPSISPLLQRLPGFQSIRSADRYAIPLTLVAAILAGYIVARFRILLLALHPGNPGMNRRRLIYVGITALAVMALFLEFLRCPVRTEAPPTPPAVYLPGGAVHCTGAVDELPGMVLEVPYWYAGGGYQSETIRFYTLYYQTRHQRPMAGGHVSRLIPSAVPESTRNPVLEFLSRRRPSKFPIPSPDEVVEFLSKFDVAFITVSRWVYPPEDEAQVRTFLEQSLDLELIFENSRFLTYRVLGSEAVPASPALSRPLDVS